MQTALRTERAARPRDVDPDRVADAQAPEYAAEIRHAGERRSVHRDDPIAGVQARAVPHARRVPDPQAQRTGALRSPGEDAQVRDRPPVGSRRGHPGDAGPQADQGESKVVEPTIRSSPAVRTGLMSVARYRSSPPRQKVSSRAAAPSRPVWCAEAVSSNRSAGIGTVIAPCRVDRERF